MLDLETDVYLFTRILQIPEADVCPITKDIAEEWLRRNWEGHGVGSSRWSSRE
uniref:Uncharacterized protein n=1 Tax=Fagus sylvatica TaxID=28930 RepID=A0A2N9II30_FAGSY